MANAGDTVNSKAWLISEGIVLRYTGFSFVRHGSYFCYINVVFYIQKGICAITITLAD